MSKKYTRVTIEVVSDVDDNETIDAVRDFVDRVSSGTTQFITSNGMRFDTAPSDADTMIDRLGASTDGVISGDEFLDELRRKEAAAKRKLFKLVD